MAHGPAPWLRIMWPDSRPNPLNSSGYGPPATYRGRAQNTDNGSAFRSKHLAMVAARLGMSLPHTPPYRPQGRGKVERIFRTIRDQCLSTLKTEFMEPLKAAFSEWLEDYHHRIHDSLGCSPLNKRLASHKVTRILPDVVQLDIVCCID